MDDIAQLLAETLDRLLDEHCTGRRIREIEAGEPAETLWSLIEESGFADALLPETDGGAGLDLAQTYPLFELCGRHAVPVPLAQTMVARAALAAAGVSPPPGSIAIGRARQDDYGAIHAPAVSFGQVADWALVALGDAAVFLRVEVRDRHVFPLDASLSWPAAALTGAAALPIGGTLLELEACLASAQLAGAMARIFEQTLDYANGRQQFGRPIGKFQTVQHQLSVMAELVFASRMAAQLGCRASSDERFALAVAAAKARTSEAALEVATIAHAVHGAIGFTAELDLQLFTRRLHAGRLSAGSESFWHDRLGKTLVAEWQGPCLDMIQAITGQGGEAP